MPHCPICGDPTLGVCCDVISAYLSEEDEHVGSHTP